MNKTLSDYLHAHLPELQYWLVPGPPRNPRSATLLRAVFNTPKGRVHCQLLCSDEFLSSPDMGDALVDMLQRQARRTIEKEA